MKRDILSCCWFVAWLTGFSFCLCFFVCLFIDDAFEMMIVIALDFYIAFFFIGLYSECFTRVETVE